MSCLRLDAGGGCFAWASDLGVPWSCVGFASRGVSLPRASDLRSVDVDQSGISRRLPCSYHADLVPAVSMATVALDCYSSNCHHGNSLQPWSLGAGIIREETEDEELQLMQFWFVKSNVTYVLKSCSAPCAINISNKMNRFRTVKYMILLVMKNA